MSDKPSYLECWSSVAKSLFEQALAGEPTFSVSKSKPMASGAFGFKAAIVGEEAGSFTVLLDANLLSASLFEDVPDQKASWAELLKEAAGAATGEILARFGRKCQVTEFTPVEAIAQVSRSFDLVSGDRTWMIQVEDGVSLKKISAPAPPVSSNPRPQTRRDSAPDALSAHGPAAGNSKNELSPGLELLLDVELEASLRFGAREMSLGEILELGPGDVVQLDRHVSDPVELIIGDKIVARGEVVLIDGNFGLRVTDVAEPQRRLESIRCLF